MLSPISFDPGSSPRIRGAHPPMTCSVIWVRIIPADTGSTLRWWAYTPNEQDHPRRCGEHCPDDLHEVCLAGSSPQIRGALRS